METVECPTMRNERRATVDGQEHSPLSLSGHSLPPSTGSFVVANRAQGSIIGAQSSLIIGAQSAAMHAVH